MAWTMVAATRHAARDTTRLAVLADSLERDGARAFMFRPRAQHVYVRGLLLAAKGREGDAIEVLRRSDVLRPLRRGWFMESTNLHSSLTEVHEMLGKAWDAAGVPDSAVVHWKRVADAWERADPVLQPRRAHAVERLASGG